jgi:hypothetical protein
MKNYFYCVQKIEDKSFQNDIINSIDRSDDVQKKNTNVKAKMTQWNMMHEPGFESLALHMLNFALQISEVKYCSDPVKNKFLFTSIWGMCYESQDYAIAHDHWPALWSCVYYIKPPKNCPELIFPELNDCVYPEDGTLVLFPSHVVHEVPKKEFIGKRYVVSANLVPDIENFGV